MAFKMFEAKFRREIQTELRRLTKFPLEDAFTDALQNLEIVFRNLLRLGAVLDVFAQVCEDRSDLLSKQNIRRASASSSVSPGMNRDTVALQTVMRRRWRNHRF